MGLCNSRANRKKRVDWLTLMHQIITFIFQYSLLLSFKMNNIQFLYNNVYKIEFV